MKIGYCVCICDYINDEFIQLVDRLLDNESMKKKVYKRGKKNFI